MRQNQISRALSDRRRRTRDTRSAARLVAEDFMAYYVALDIAVKIDMWLPMAKPAPSLDQWHEHQAVLAESVSGEDWRLLRITTRRLAVIQRLADSIPGLQSRRTRPATNYETQPTTR